MSNEIEHALQVLVGAPFVGTRRVVDMEAFSFGRLIVSGNPRAPGRLVAEFNLHVQCPWRVVCSDQIIVGYGDMTDPPTGVQESEFDANTASITRRDELMERFNALGEVPRRVVTCTASIRGDVRIGLSDECVLELFPDSSPGEEYHEYWRLIMPDGAHLVMSALGLERLPA